MKLQRDEFGIPVLDAQDIERIAYRFLSHAAPECVRRPVLTPIVEIMMRLRVEGQCGFSFDEDLRTTPEGYKYLGRYNLRTKHISIDRSLSPDNPRFVFTSAHELGHFYLHSKVRPEALALPSDTITDSTRDLVTHRIEGSRPRSLMEWQANRFAAGILVPSATCHDALAELQVALGIPRPGRIWLDKQPHNQRAFSTIVQRMAATYNVSKTVIRYRLAELNLLVEDTRGQLTRAGASLSDVLAEVFGRI